MHRRPSLAWLLLMSLLGAPCAFANEQGVQTPYPYPAILGCTSDAVTGGLALGCEVGFLAPVTQDTSIEVRILGVGDRTPHRFTLPAGQSRLAFQIGTRPVAQPTPVDIAVTAVGQTLTTTRTVMPPQVTDVELKAPEIPGGAASEGSVTLSGPVPAGGLAIHLASSNPGVVRVPDPVWAPAFATRISFPISTQAVKQNQAVMISAAIGDSTRTTRVVVAQHPKADLAIYRWIFMNAHGDRVTAPPANQPFITCVDIINQSYGSAPATKLRTLLMDNTGITHIEWKKKIRALGPGQDARACIAMPRLDPHHSYVINMYADADNQVDESDKDNNFQAYERQFSSATVAPGGPLQPHLQLPESAPATSPPI